MKVSVVPAQITTVEDRIAGNLNFTGTNNYFTSNTYFGNSTVRSTINQYTQSIINLTLMGY